MVIGKAIKKYGKENFTLEELSRASSIEELNELEIAFIEKYQSLSKGYNCRPGGRNYILTEDNKKALQKSHIKQQKAVVQYDKGLNKIAEFFSIKEAARLTGTDDSGIVSCCRQQGSYRTANGYVWAYLGDKPKSPIWEGKSVVQLDKSNNKIAEFPSAMEASRQTRIARSKISECCNKVRKTSGGFLWKFKENM